MITKLDFSNDHIVREVLDLQLEAYKVEAEIIGFEEIPPLKDTINTLRACGETFYGYFVEEKLAGIISFKIYDDVLDIHRVAVHPQFFRRGIANKLISFIEKCHRDIKKIIVSTGKENKPAVKLYLNNDYKKVEDIEIEEGFYLTAFEKLL